MPPASRRARSGSPRHPSSAPTWRHRRVSGDHLSFVLEAIAIGLGIGLVPPKCTERAAGLVPILPTYGSSGGMESLVHPSRHLPHRVRLVRDFLSDRLSTRCPKHA